MKDKKTESVVDFLYEHIYCRYMSPGECIVHDNGGEFDGNLMKTLAKDMNIDLRRTKGGRPWANGQAEAAVKLVKNKIKMIALENSDSN